MQGLEKNLKSLKLIDSSNYFSNKKNFTSLETLKNHLNIVAPKLKTKPTGFLLRAADIKTPKVTVIIPCYNTQAYINQCIDSVLTQSIDSIELIIVDDCSSDETLTTLLRYAQQDSRISLVTLAKQSGSPGRARNIGMTLARAPYIYFLDSDDWLDSHTLENLFKTAQSNDSEICFLSGFMNHLGDKLTKRYYKKPISDQNSHLMGFHESFMLWDKLWSTTFLKSNKLKVAHTSASEELLFILKAYYLARKTSVSTGNYGYNYRRLNDSSITKNIRSNAYPSFEFQAWRLVDDWLEDNTVTDAYRRIVALRKILSFNYALSIVHIQHRNKFISEISGYLASTLDDGVRSIAQELNYLDQVENFSNLVPSVSGPAVKSSARRANNILFGPDWSSSNPYQKLLYKSIRAVHGNYATGFSPRQLTKEYLSQKSGTNGILHLHWLHPFYDGAKKNSAKEFITTLTHAKNLGYKLVWTAHNIMPHDISEASEPTHTYVRQAVLDLCDAVITHDHRTMTALEERFKFDSKKCVIAPHGLYEKTLPDKPAVKTAVRDTLGIARDRFTVLLAGRIRGYKGIERAINIFLNGKRSITDSCTLVIAGYPDDVAIDEKIQLAAALNCEIKYVRGAISDEDLEALFIASDICLLPYEKSSTSGLAFLSISYKTPLITSKLPAFEQFIQDGMGLWADTDEGLERAIEYASSSFYTNSFRTIFSALNDESTSHLEWTSIVKLPAYSRIFK